MSIFFLRRLVMATCLLALQSSMSILAQSTWVRPPSGTIEFLSGVAYGDGRYVAVGESGTIRSSSDGASWSGETSGTAEALRSVVFANGLFVAVGKTGTVLTSPDGMAWTPETSGTTNFLSGVTYGNGRYVAVGSSGRIITSTDASSWSQATSLTSSFLQDVHFGNGKFIAVGSSGTIRTSTDGLTWNFVPNPLGSSFLTGSGSFAGKHYIVGQNGALLSSPDASSWTIENATTLSWLRSMTTDGITAVVVGDGGTIITSTDGTTWTAATSGVNTILSGAAFGGNKFVTVGEPAANTAVILTSERDPGIFWAATEATIGEADGMVNLTVERSGSLAAGATVDYTTVAGSAQAGVDFTSTNGTATFLVGQDQTQIMVPITNNPEAEPPESFGVTLSNQSPVSLVLYAPESILVNIVDAQDSDFDGLPDDWEILHFGDLSHGPDDDSDSDSNSNSLELADGTDPSDPDSALYRLVVSVVSGNGTVAQSPDMTAYPKGTSVTLTPAGIGAYAFESWSGDASGSLEPLAINMDSDKNIGAIFSISLADALDGDCLDWITTGDGPAWEGQDTVTSDGIDAATASDLVLGQQSAIETTIYGPAEISFQWKLSIGAFDSLRFSVDGSSRASRSGQLDWEPLSFLVGAGEHTICWTYSKNSPGGLNQVWLDQVSVKYDYTTWQQAFFNPVEVADPLVSGELADPEGDGIPNLLEFILGLDPRADDSESENLGLLEDDGSGFKFTWKQHKKRSGVTLTLEYSDTLLPGSWQTVSEPSTVVAETGELQTLQVEILPITDRRRFYRLTAALSE